jgi:hypothetical protein
MDLFFAAFSGAWFGIFMLAFIVIGIVANEMDSFWMGAATLLVGLAGMEFLFDVPVWASIFANPLMLLLYAAVYVAVGSLYTGLWSWPNFIREHADNIKMDYGSWKNDLIRSNRVEKRRTLADLAQGKEAEQADEITDPNLDTSFETFLDSSNYRYPASRHKDRLAAWVLMWPFGLLWDLMHRPARWIWNTVYSGLGQVFERVSKQTARKIYDGK